MKDILLILMVAFGLFAIVMFVLFYVYLKKYYNKKHLEDDYEKVGEEDIESEDVNFENDSNIPFEPIQEENNNYTSNLNVNDNSDGEFIPIKKK